MDFSKSTYATMDLTKLIAQSAIRSGGEGTDRVIALLTVVFVPSTFVAVRLASSTASKDHKVLTTVDFTDHAIV